MLAGVAQTLDKIDGNTGGYDAWQWKVCACKLSFVRMGTEVVCGPQLMALLCGIAAAIVMVPVFLVLSYGVRVNSHLSSHHGKLLRLKYVPYTAPVRRSVLMGTYCGVGTCCSAGIVSVSWLHKRNTDTHSDCTMRRRCPSSRLLAIW